MDVTINTTPKQERQTLLERVEALEVWVNGLQAAVSGHDDEMFPAVYKRLDAVEREVL